jgi:DnaJ-class molecular chaperone
MLKELRQKIEKVECLACNVNGSLNSFDSYSCPICQGTGFVEVQALEKEQFPLSNPVSDKKGPLKVVKPMLVEMKPNIGLVDCLACNGSLNSYDSYSCPICQGTGFVEVQALEETQPPKVMANAEIMSPEERLIPETGSIADGYEFRIEHL